MSQKNVILLTEYPITTTELFWVQGVDETSFLTGSFALPHYDPNGTVWNTFLECKERGEPCYIESLLDDGDRKNYGKISGIMRDGADLVVWFTLKIPALVIFGGA